MRTLYHYPSTTVQSSVVPEALEWLDDDNNPDTPIINSNGLLSVTNKPIYSVAKNDLLVSTDVNQIIATNFKFILPDDSLIHGIEMQLTAQRLSRIQDEVIHLVFNGEKFGLNLKNPNAENVQVYGGPTDTWGWGWIPEEIMSESFGVIVGLGSNSKIPHRDLGYIESVGIRIYHS